MRSLDVPLAVGGRVEGGDRGGVVDQGAVHTSAGRQSHSQGVGVNMAVTGGVEAGQHLKI